MKLRCISIEYTRPPKAIQQSNIMKIITSELNGTKSNQVGRAASEAYRCFRVSPLPEGVTLGIRNKKNVNETHHSLKTPVFGKGQIGA